MTSVLAVHALALPFLPPSDLPTNHLMLLRWVHFVAGLPGVDCCTFLIWWNVPFLKELDARRRAGVSGV